jgi:hypothetical protein
MSFLLIGCWSDLYKTNIFETNEAGNMFPLGSSKLVLVPSDESGKRTRYGLPLERSCFDLHAQLCCFG